MNIDEILEIGPGEGALTDKLIKKTNYLYGVEIDPLLIKKLTFWLPLLLLKVVLISPLLIQ